MFPLWGSRLLGVAIVRRSVPPEELHAVPAAPCTMRVPRRSPRTPLYSLRPPLFAECARSFPRRSEPRHLKERRDDSCCGTRCWRKRAAKNQSLLREVNERIEELSQSVNRTRFICECTNESCDERVLLTPEASERI